jgi:plasmid stabilization system protein ParE
MTLAVVFRRAARREFDEAALWYEERRLGLGAQFVSEIDRAVYLAAESPQRFPNMHRDVRCVRARRFPYSVFFRAESRRIVVLSVFHARRNPSVWQQRA